MPHFLDFPAELRNKIYEMALHQQCPLEVRRKHVFELRQTDRALTQVSRQIRNESQPIYYSSNMFSFSSMRDNGSWLHMLGAQCQNLRHVKLRERVAEGLHWPTTSEPWGLQLVNFSIRLAKGLPANFTAESEVDYTVEALACETVKPIADVLSQFSSYDLVVTGRISHCAHCMGGGGCLRCYHNRGCCTKA